MAEDSLVKLIFEDGREFFIHVTQDLTPNYAQSATQNPIENGANKTDHVSQQPFTLSLTGWLTDTPWPGSFLFGLIEFLPAPADQHIDFADRIKQATKGEFVTVDAGRKGRYENLVITNYTENHDSEHGDTIPFSIQFQQVDIVETQIKGFLEMALDTLMGMADTFAGGHREPRLAGPSGASAVSATTFPGADVVDFVRGE